ncbi:MAG: hypothetical protein LBS17_05580 [Actinomycetes bacterium]|jgi:hypothetical protein|nr:hypothetical protein [Actinomycetes bacterium]
MARKKKLFVNLLEQRTIDYIVRELGQGRELFDILDDPFVRNRIPPERMHALREDEDLLAAFLAEIEAVRDKMKP